MQFLDPLLAVQGGGYISPFKLIVVLIILAVWLRLLTWADEDAQAAHLPRVNLNLANLGGLIVAYALFLLLPTFILSFFSLLIILGVEAAVYLNLRNNEVGLRDLQKQFNNWVRGIKGEEKDTNKEVVGLVAITGKDGKLLPVPDEASPDRPAFDAVQRLLEDPIRKGAQQVDLAPEGDGSQLQMKYTVDNVVHRGDAFERALATAAISYIKWATGLNIEDRRKPQTGILKVSLDKVKHELRVQTAGTTAGEYLRISVDPKGRYTLKVPVMGFTDVQQALMTDLVQQKGGLVLLSAPKGHGLTTLLYSVLRSHDAFMEHAQTVEHDAEQDLEGITQNKVPPNASGADILQQVDWVISQEPDVLGVSKVDDPRVAASILEFAKNKRAYVCLRANSTFEAVEQWKRIVGDASAATEPLRVVINGRVLRKLCMACKEGFTPDPATLKKLNLSPDKVTTLFKARETALRDPKGNPVRCQFCFDIRYKGMQGVYETMIVDDEVRATIEANKALAQVFRKQRGRYLQEEALAIVEKGETSVQEVLRVLKPPADTAAKPAAAAASRGRR